MPRVSVIIPSYNRAEMLDISVTSVLEQSFTDFEILIIDDGSKDNTKEKVESFNDARIKYIYKKNGGVSSARNAGIDNSSGEFIAFLDDDDCWPADYLEKIMAVMDKDKDIGLAYCKTVFVKDGQIKKTDDVRRCFSGDITEKLFQMSSIWPSAVFVRKCIVKDTRFDLSLTVAEDSDFFLRLSVGIKCLFVDSLTVQRNDTSQSLSKSFNCARILVLERFYYKLGGDKIISAKIAARKLGKAYYSASKKQIKAKSYTSAKYLLRKAIKHCPDDWKFYLKYLSIIVKNSSSDKDWSMPEELGLPEYVSN
jgi:glycosyltransferase involved in cell wall biosynthesis